MSDIIDSYISKVDFNNLPKKINHFYKKFDSKRKYFIKLIFVRFFILKARIDLTIKYFKLGKFVSKSFIDENVIDFSYKDKFFYLGPKNDWRKTLDIKISESIALEFKKEMKELGYL